MGITQEEADAIESEFMDAIPGVMNYSEGDASQAFAAWNHLIEVMVRENNMSDHLGIDSIDWQIGNWANDTVEALHNAHLYEEEISVNEQILQIRWSSGSDLFYENAQRDIADTYADMGNPEKCLQLYAKYLNDDPLWGWGWIGYFRQLHEYDLMRFKPVLDDLYRKTKEGINFRDKEDLYRELGDEYNTLGDQEKADYFYSLEDAERNSSVFGGRMPASPVVKPKKIYPNDPCPCGSGKKYKKCCGKK